MAADDQDGNAYNLCWEIMRKPIMVYSTLKKSQVIPVVPGALGTIQEGFRKVSLE